MTSPYKFFGAAALSLVLGLATLTVGTKTAQANEAAAGVIGFVAGAIVGSALTSAQYNRGYYAAPRHVYVAPRRAYVAPRAAYVVPRRVYSRSAVVYRQPRVVYARPRAVVVHRSYRGVASYRHGRY